MSEDIPSYLKSLESLLGSTVPPSSTPAKEEKEETNTPSGAASTSTTPSAASTSTTAGAASTSSKELTLSSIGFGSIMKNASDSTATAAAAKDDGKLRLLFVSTHIHQFTGYSKISHGILQQLSKQSSWLSVTHFGFQKFHDVGEAYRQYPHNIEVIDAAQLEKPPSQGFAFEALPEIIRKKKPHVVLIYNDLAVVTQYIENIRKSGIPRTFKLWVYADQVFTVQNQLFIDNLNRDADRIFAFTPFWKKCLKDQGVTRPIDVLLHGFDPKKNFSIPRELARRHLSLPPELFVFLNLNRNQPRKRYDILIMAFVELIVKYPTKPIHLLCICDKGDKGGWWLFDIFARELKLRGASIDQFKTRLILTAQNMIFKDEDINMFYNAADAGISTSDGEGWGLCQFEQMGVGVPQVVPDIGGYKEFCTPENSILIQPKVRYYLPTVYCPVGGEAMACDPHDVCLAMEEYVLNSEKKEAHGKAAKEKVLSYTWERGCETFIKRLKSVKDEDD